MDIGPVAIPPILSTPQAVAPPPTHVAGGETIGSHIVNHGISSIDGLLGLLVDIVA